MTKAVALATTLWNKVKCLFRMTVARVLVLVPDSVWDRGVAFSHTRMGEVTRVLLLGVFLGLCLWLCSYTVHLGLFLLFAPFVHTVGTALWLTGPAYYVYTVLEFFGYVLIGAWLLRQLWFQNTVIALLPTDLGRLLVVAA